jgi:hypothetical protein
MTTENGYYNTFNRHIAFSAHGPLVRDSRPQNAQKMCMCSWRLRELRVSALGYALYILGAARKGSGSKKCQLSDVDEQG